jgi:hypothetical protein
MKFDWRHIAAIILTVAIWIAWGLSKGPLPQLAPYFPVLLPIVAPVFAWLGLTSPKLPPVFGRRVGPTAVLMLCGAGIGTQGCSWLASPQGAATVQAGVDLAVCVLNHSNEPIQQIVTDCGASTAGDVIKILDAHRAAMMREKADGGQ